MKILIIDYKLPFPFSFGGGRIRAGNFTKSLASEHELSLLLTGKDDNVDCSKLKTYFKNIWTIDYKTYGKKLNNRRHRIGNLIKGIPWEIAKSYSAEFEEKLLKIIKEHDLDIIFVRYIYLAQYLIRNRNKIKAKTIVDLDDIEFMKVTRCNNIEGDNGIYDKYRKKVNNWLFKCYHKKINSLDCAIVCSNEDRNYLRDIRLLKNVCVIPNAVDVAAYSKVKPFDRHVFNKKIILFIGDLTYSPNIDAIKWFVKAIFPAIKQDMPNVELQIVGRGIGKEIYSLSGKESVFIFPDVPNVIPYYNESSLVVVPLRAGGGTRIKILEAFSCRRPVVSTTIGAEGLGLVNKKTCIIEDTPEKFAYACLQLLSDFDIAYKLTEDSYRYVLDNYNIEVVEKLIRNLFNGKNENSDRYNSVT